MFCVTGNSLYLAHKEEVLWPEKENPQVKSTGLSASFAEGHRGVLRSLVAVVDHRVGSAHSKSFG